MASRISQPRLKLSESRTRLLNLLFRLLEEECDANNSNLPLESLAVTERDALELGKLLTASLDESTLVRAIWFIEGFTGARELSEKQLSEILMSERRKNGYSRAISSSQWHQFLTRFGSSRPSQSTLVVSATRMDFDHFLKMESKLFSDLGASLAARNRMLKSVETEEEKLEEMRNLAANFRQGSAKLFIGDSLKKLQESLVSKVPVLSANQVTGAAIFLSNATVMFASRDWGVAGTISSMAGGLIQIKSK